MKLNVTIGDDTWPLEVPEGLLSEAEDFFSRMDANMNRGWQMSRNWVDSPNAVQRCQIVADKLLTAFHNRNREMADLTAAYILKRLPGVSSVDIATDGDMTGTRFETNGGTIPPAN